MGIGGAEFPLPAVQGLEEFDERLDFERGD
jgi:hypothetical protein